MSTTGHPQASTNRMQSAVMKESLRYGMPVPGRLPRIVPPGIEPIIIDGKEIPAGVCVLAHGDIK